MNKRILFLFVTIVICLNSCDSKRNNIIVDGHYSGVDTFKKTIFCDLFIKEIDKDEYTIAKGKNTIVDAINGKFYSIEFNINETEKHENRVNFFNFKDTYDNARGTPISYVDDNGWWLTPLTSDNNKILSKSMCSYSVSINSKDFQLFSYLNFLND